MTASREYWSSNIGFVLTAVGSAVGLANIVRFPYLVGQNGGAAFILVYLLCLAIIGFPTLVTEVLIGRTSHKNPAGAFAHIGGNSFWRQSGVVVITTGFLVSAFYSALAGWIIGYLIEAIQGDISSFTQVKQSTKHFESLIAIPSWTVLYHGVFMAMCMLILNSGIRNGLERASKVFMPLMLMLLLYLCFVGLSLPNTKEALNFLFNPNWQGLTMTSVLIALGQAFFTLSLGQGTMITYGSYLSRRENILSTCLPIVLADTFISILAAVVVMTIVFGVGMDPDSGIGLIFNTLPVVFSKLANGKVVAILFFTLVSLAALTSEMSALEPSIAYLMDERGWSRFKSVTVVGLGAFIVGIPSALSYSWLNHIQIQGGTILEAMDFITTALLIPLGGLLSVLLIGWRLGISQSMIELSFGSRGILNRYPILQKYLSVSIKYISPLVILVIATSYNVLN